jgi:signal transduction histidine kinase
VSDTGVGISEQKLPSLLKPFTRGTESMQYNYEGLGLGLYTDKIIADKLGGTITIRSKLGSGTTTTIALPMGHEVSVLAPQLIMPEVTPTAM